MSNDITNKLVINGETEEVNKVLDFIKIEKESDKLINGIGTIDFNKITPMPKWVYGSGSEIGVSIEAEIKYGKNNTCVEWSKFNWGTKRNAYCQPDSRNTSNTIYFQTASTNVSNLIQKLAWIFPNVVIEYYYLCDSENLGKYVFKDTDVEEYIPEYRSKESYELTFEIEQCTPEDCNLKYNSTIGNYEDFDYEKLKKSILWKYDSELGIAYVCPNCKLFLCGGISQTKCKCGQEIDWDDMNNEKNEYKGRIKWN